MFAYTARAINHITKEHHRDSVRTLCCWKAAFFSPMLFLYVVSVVFCHGVVSSLVDYACSCC